MASSGCFLPQFLAYVISNYIYLKGSLKYIFSASVAFMFHVKRIFALFLRTSCCIAQNVMCCKPPPCPPCIVFIKETIYTPQPRRGPIIGEKVTEALPQSHPIVDSTGSSNSCLRGPPVPLFDVPSKYRSLAGVLALRQGNDRILSL